MINPIGAANPAEIWRRRVFATRVSRNQRFDRYRVRSDYPAMPKVWRSKSHNSPCVWCHRLFFLFITLGSSFPSFFSCLQSEKVSVNRSFVFFFHELLHSIIVAISDFSCAMTLKSSRWQLLLFMIEMDVLRADARKGKIVSIRTYLHALL